MHYRSTPPARERGVRAHARGINPDEAGCACALFDGDLQKAGAIKEHLRCSEKHMQRGAYAARKAKQTELSWGGSLNREGHSQGAASNVVAPRTHLATRPREVHETEHGAL